MFRSVSICLAAVVCLFGCASQTRIETSFHSWKWYRDHNVVIQSFDYSCGAGALATLMRYYFGADVSEEDVLLNILGTMTEEDIRDREKNGLSLLDLKHCAESMGYQATGVKLKYASLPRLKGPVIVHIEQDDYKHFVVLKGVRDDRVFLADPSRGNIRMSINRFAQEWTGVALILGKKGFGLPMKYPLAIADQEPVQNELLAARRALYIRP
jgi:predicted double-glycine peptidase